MSDTRSEAPGPRPSPFGPAWVLAGLYLFGIGFGFVEAVVVVDLRAILTPAVVRIAGHSSEDRFPLIPFDRITSDDPAVARLMRIEVWREAATMILLAGVGLAAGRSFVGRFAAFVVGFGVWDLTYYLFLKLLIGWPASVWTWDVLFLIPVPWAAPVLAPALVAATMVLAGSIVIAEEAAGRPFRVSRWDWLALVAGGLVLIASFCWDWRNIAAGGLPNPFAWPLYTAGEVMAVGGFVHAWRASRGDQSAPSESIDSEFPETAARDTMILGRRGSPAQ
jgi:hypothetical protein